MKTCGPRQLLAIIIVVSFSLATVGADDPRGPAAVLRAGGNARVNGTASLEITTLFSGDSIQTGDDSVANITGLGSSILVMPNTVVRFLGAAVEVDQGGVRIATFARMAAKADGLTIAPVGQRLSKFEVAENEDWVVIAARQGDVTVSDRKQSLTVPEGKETRRAKTNGRGAVPAASGTHVIPGNTRAILGAEGAVVAAAIVILASKTGKKCVSPSGEKTCN